MLRCNLKKILEDRNVSMREFSRQCDVTFETIRKLCNNKTRQYTKETLEKVCSTLNIEIGELLTLEEAKKDEAEGEESTNQ